jgi:hypothetical protein
MRALSIVKSSSVMRLVKFSKEMGCCVAAAGGPAIAGAAGATVQLHLVLLC